MLGPAIASVPDSAKQEYDGPAQVNISSLPFSLASWMPFSVCPKGNTMLCPGKYSPRVPQDAAQQIHLKECPEKWVERFSSCPPTQTCLVPEA